MPYRAYRGTYNTFCARILPGLRFVRRFGKTSTNITCGRYHATSLSAFRVHSAHLLQVVPHIAVVPGICTVKRGLMAVSPTTRFVPAVRDDVICSLAMDDILGP